MGSLSSHRPPLLDAFLVSWASQIMSNMLSFRKPVCERLLRPWTGHLALIETRRDGRFRFLLIGTKLKPRFNPQWVCRGLEEIDRDLLGNLEERLSWTIRLGQPMITRVSVPYCPSPYVDFLVPIRGRDGQIDMVLMASTREDCQSDTLH